MTSRVRAGLADLLPRGRAAVLLTGVALVDSIGTGVYLGGSVILFTQVIGLRPAAIGSALSIAGLVGIAASLAWGALADRTGPRGTLVVLNLLRGLGFLAYVVVDDFTSFLAVAVFLGLLEKAMSPITTAVVSAALDETSRVHTLAVLRSVRNVGFTLGTLASSLALVVPGRTGLVVVVVANAATFVLAAGLLAAVPQPYRPPPARRSLPGWRLLGRRPRFAGLALLNGVLALHNPVLAVGLPLYTVTVLGLPAPLVPVLIAVNTVLVVLFQVRFSRGCEQAGPASAALGRAGGALAVTALALGGAQLVTPAPLLSVAGLAVLGLVLLGVLALTAGELWQSAGGWGMSLLLSPEHARSRFLTAFTLGTSVTEAVGVVLVTGLLVELGWPAWFAAALLFAAAGLAARRLGPHALVEADAATTPRTTGSVHHQEDT